MLYVTCYMLNRWNFFSRIKEKIVISNWQQQLNTTTKYFESKSFYLVDTNEKNVKNGCIAWMDSIFAWTREECWWRKNIANQIKHPNYKNRSNEKQQLAQKCVSFSNKIIVAFILHHYRIKGVGWNLCCWRKTLFTAR